MVGFICPGDTVVARTVADDFRDFVLFGDRLREHRAAPTPGNARAIPLNRRKDGPPCGGIIATGWRREASTAWLKSMRYCTLTDMHDRDVVGIEPPPSRQII